MSSLTPLSEQCSAQSWAFNETSRLEYAARAMTHDMWVGRMEGLKPFSPVGIARLVWYSREEYAAEALSLRVSEQGNTAEHVEKLFKGIKQAAPPQWWLL